MYRATVGTRRYIFDDLKTLLGKASPLRSGDQLAGVAAETEEERVAAQQAAMGHKLVALLVAVGVLFDLWCLVQN